MSAAEAAAFRAAAGKPFSIGLSPIDPGDWIEVDEFHAEQCSLKTEILEHRPVFDRAHDRRTRGLGVNGAEAAAFRAAAARPFSIGMAPIAVDDWIEVDELHAAQCALKAEILAREGKEAFDATPGSEPAQGEAKERLVAHLRRRFPHVSTALAADEPPLKAIARCVQEDLLLMGRKPEGWTLQGNRVKELGDNGAKC